MTGPRRRLDNRPEGAERPTDVRRDELEQALREALSRQVAVPRPLTVDPAGLAIERARRINRRRTVASFGLAAVATVMLSAGMAQLSESMTRNNRPAVVFGDPSPSITTPSPEPVGPIVNGTPVDLVIGATLTTSGGATVDLAVIGPAEQALRKVDGLLVVGAPTSAGRTLWFVDAQGDAQVVLAGVGTIVLSPDGQQVAWREGAELRVAGLINGQVIAAVRTAAPASVVPERFVGDAVLVRQGAAGSTSTRYSLWRPAGGLFTPQWRAGLLAVHGVLPDGRLVGQVADRSGGRCLALLDAADQLVATQTGCGFALSADGHGTVSPDGRWLVVNGRADQSAGAASSRGTPQPGTDAATGETALLIELGRAFDRSAVLRAAGPRLVGRAAWIREGTALVHVDQQGGLVELPVDRGPAGSAIRTDRTVLPGVDPETPVTVVVGATDPPRSVGG